ncbi:LPXTG cell wall anchor domain-containing protein [Clostridium baratii]|uniref:LPXTG cell wall anchor domain-containing protein n=1 Tax=Clostridium baratii TaxID=1561 RepID=UPI0030CD0026
MHLKRFITSTISILIFTNFFSTSSIVFADTKNSIIKENVYTKKSEYDQAFSKYVNAYESYQKAMKDYQKKLKENQYITEENKTAQKAYEKALSNYNSENTKYLTKLYEYNKAVDEFHKVQDENKNLLDNYSKQVEEYRVKLKEYSDILKEYEKTLKDTVNKNNEADIKYKNQIEEYDKKLKEYNQKLIEYNKLIEQRNITIQSNKDKQTKYESDLAVYKKETEKYEQARLDYNKKKQAHDDAINKNEKLEFNYANEVNKYQKSVDKYNKDLNNYQTKVKIITENKAAGHYTVPSSWDTLYDLYTFFINYDATLTYLKYDLTKNNTNMVDQVNIDKKNNPMPNTKLNSLFKELIDELNSNYKYLYSIDANMNNYYKVTEPLVINTVKDNTVFSSNMKGNGFYYEYTSTTGQTKSNIPQELNNPTKKGIEKSLENLFVLTNNKPFDASNRSIGQTNQFVSPDMVNKWKEALSITQSESEKLFEEALKIHISAYNVYNNSDHGSDDLNTLNTTLEEANNLESRAFHLIQGYNMPLLNKYGTFVNDLEKLNSKELADKYGYLILLGQMSNLAVYGYFDLLKPQPGEIIQVNNSQAYADGYYAVKVGTEDVTPQYPKEPIKPTPPTSPEFLIVPNVPDDPVPPESLLPPDFEEVPSEPILPKPPVNPEPPIKIDMPKKPVGLTPPISPIPPVLYEKPEVPKQPIAPNPPKEPILKELISLGEPPVPPVMPELNEITTNIPKNTSKTTVQNIATSDSKESKKYEGFNQLPRTGYTFENLYLYIGLMFLVTGLIIFKKKKIRN